MADATRAAGAVPNFSGFGVGIVADTFVIPELFGVDLIRDMYVMAETDETVGSMLFAISSTMRQIKWAHVPQIDGVDAPDDPEAKKWAAMADSWLIDMNRPMASHVQDSLTMLWAGFAPIEIVAKQRNSFNSRFTDGYYGIKALNLLDQLSVWDWVYEDNQPVAMRQIGSNVIGPGTVPLSKTLLYRTNDAYNRPQGKPLLKPAWRPWRLKRKIQDSEALGIERELCGLPIFEMPMEDIDAQYETEADGVTLTQDAKRARQIVRAAQAATQDMRLNKSGGIVLPSNTYAEDNGGQDTARKYQFRILSTGGQRAIDSRTAARDYDHAIARVAMMQFLTLGQRSGGSYGLSEDQSSMAVSSIMALADIAGDEWNLKTIPMMWGINVFPPKYRPRLGHSDVNKNGITQLGQFLAGVSKSADLWGGDFKARTSLLTAAGIDYDADAQRQAADTAQKTAEQQAEPPPAPVVAPPGGGAPKPAPKPAPKE